MRTILAEGQHEVYRNEVVRRSRPDSTTGCWLWVGWVIGGYGCLKQRGLNGGMHTKAHRLAYAAFKEEPGDLCVMHTCDVRLCVNPKHLLLGTRADNNADMLAKGRARRTGVPRAKVSFREVSFLTSLGYTQQRIAEMFGVHQATIWSRLNEGEV